MSDDEQHSDLVTVTVNLLEINLDRAALSAASLGETMSETINRAIAVYHELMALQAGMTLSWQYADGTRAAVVRIR